MHSCTDDQGGIEPSAILIAALEIQIGRIAQSAFHHGSSMRASGVKPYIHRIGFLAEFSIWGAWVCIALRQQLLRVLFKPDIAAMLTEQLCHMGKYSLIHNRRIILRIENRNRNTPCTLTGNTPVTAIGNHIVHALLSPLRNPVNIRNLCQQLFTNLINRRKPLRCCTEDNRLLCSPVMRIGVRNELQL